MLNKSKKALSKVVVETDTYHLQTISVSKFMIMYVVFGKTSW